MPFSCRFSRRTGTASGDPCCAECGPGPPVVPCADPVSPAAPRAAPVPSPAPARYAQPVQVYRRRSAPTSAPRRYAEPVQVYQRRSASTPVPPPAPEAPTTPTPEPSPPPPPPAPSRAEPEVYHPPVVHRDPRHIHPMVTRRMASQAATLSATEGEPRVSPVPSSVCDALADPRWRRAMEEEYAALLANQTWDLVPCPSGCNVVTGKWIWTHKRRADGTLER